jgi:hypothetical protein
VIITAPHIGINERHEWPYGLHVDQKARRGMVAWAEKHGLRYQLGADCLHWLLTGSCTAEICLDRNTYDWMDHVTGFSRDGFPAVLVCQPYGLHGTDIVGSLARLGIEYDLDVHIDGTGWYGHGTTFVQLRRVTQ